MANCFPFRSSNSHLCCCSLYAALFRSLLVPSLFSSGRLLITFQRQTMVLRKKKKKGKSALFLCLGSLNTLSAFPFDSCKSASSLLFPPFHPTHRPFPISRSPTSPNQPTKTIFLWLFSMHFTRAASVAEKIVLHQQQQQQMAIAMALFRDPRAGEKYTTALP